MSGERRPATSLGEALKHYLARTGFVERLNQAGVVGEHLAQQRDRAHVEVVGSRGAVLQETRLPELAHQPPADRVRVRVVRMRQVARSPGVGLARERRVTLLQKRPVVVREAVHARPLLSMPFSVCCLTVASSA